MRDTARDGDPFAEPASGKSRKMWLALLSCVLGIVIVIHPDAVTDLVSILKDLGVAIWRMICDVASACGGFVDYVLKVRAG